jgi:hypothetical protein
MAGPGVGTADRAATLTCPQAETARGEHGCHCAARPIPAGEHQIRIEFAYDGGALGKGGTVTLFYDGDKVGEGRVQATQPMIFSADETTDIGDDFGMPVSSGYGGMSMFNGKIDLVQIDLGDHNHDHLIDMEEVIRIACARQAVGMRVEVCGYSPPNPP